MAVHWLYRLPAKWLITVAMAAATTFGATAPASEVELTIDDVVEDPAPADLAEAIGIANQAGNDNERYTTEVEIVLNANQTASSGTAGTVNPLFFIHGGVSDATPTDLRSAGGTDYGGFLSVSLSSGSTTQYTIGFADGATNRNRALEIINVHGTGSSITVDNLKITNGLLSDSANPDLYLGGGGMYLGAASGTTKYPSAAGEFAETITVSNTLVSNNAVELTTTGATGRAAIGGGAFIDGTDYANNKAGSKVVFTNVDFSKNSVSVTSTSTDPTGSSSFGGGVRIKNAKEFTYTTGTISGNTATTTYGSHAAGGGIAIDDYTLKATLSKLTISGNTAFAEERGDFTGYPAKALGGGLYTLHDGTDGTELALTVTETEFSKNIAKAEGADVDAYGGGAYLNSGTKGAFTSVGFTENEATSSDGDAWGGGLAQTSALDLTVIGSEFTGNKATAENNAWGGGVYSQGTLVVDGSSLKTNAASGSWAQGGGICSQGDAEIKGGSIISGNTANGSQYATGGGIHAMGLLTVDKATVSENIVDAGLDGGQGGGIFTDVGAAATITESEITANEIKNGPSSQGGGIYAGGALTLSQSKIGGNKITSETDGFGGGLYTFGAATVSGTTFADNTITAAETGWGGGIAVDMSGSADITGGAISGNTVSAEKSYGGGLYAQGATTLTDANVTKNTATGSTEAFGGGIYVDTEAGSSGVLSLVSTEGETTEISGNTANEKASGVHFGGGAGGVAGVLNVDSAGTINLYDPLTVGMKDGGSFTMNRTGSGIFNWGGANTFSAGGGSTINLNSGANYLTRDFTATAEDGTNLSVYLGGTFGFDGARDNDSAMFTFSGNLTDVLSFHVGTVLDVDMSSELLDTTKTYLFADNYEGDDSFDGQSFITDNVTSTLNVTGDQVYLTSVYKTIYGDVLALADPNTQSAIDSGALPDIFRTLTDEERADLTSSSLAFNNSTPGWFLNNLFVAQETIITGATTAVKYGLRKKAPAEQYLATNLKSDGALASFDNIANTGPRFWSGYIGDFDTMDSHSRYYGYKSNRHGFIAGFNYDLAQTGSIGIYGGYTHTITKAKDITAKIKSDTGHVGLIGRLSPIRSLPQFTIYADAGYTFSTDDTERGSGSVRTTGDFETKFYTVGLELEYTARLGCAFLAPYLSGRYVRLRQDEFTERGALASHMDEITDDAFMTRVGAAFGYDFVYGGGIVTPSVNVAWRHDYGDRQYDTNAFYQSVAYPTPVRYQVKTTKFDRDSVDIGVALQTRLKTVGGQQIGINFGYNLNVGSNRDNHSVYAGFDLTF